MRILKPLAVIMAFLSGCTPFAKGLYPSVDIQEKDLQAIVEELTALQPPRNYQNRQSLDRAASMIFHHFQEHGYRPEFQEYDVEGHVYKNVIAHLGPPHAPRIVVGAHYDVYGNQPGADDNASGIAGLLTVAKLLRPYESSLHKRVEFVAYTLEEPPFFRTEHMGSFVHAKSLHDHNIEVAGMVVLEMIGYFSNQAQSQTYPISVLEWFYPSQGNFIGVVSNLPSISFRGQFAAHMKKANIAVRTLAAPEFLVGVDFSDHLNYWHFNYPAVMVTDTAFYRNANYHQPSDTLDSLNFTNMKEVVRGVFFSVLNLARTP